jgi:RNA polymerase sigma factor (sigma-70 family)
VRRVTAVGDGAPFVTKQASANGSDWRPRGETGRNGRRALPGPAPMGPYGMSDYEKLVEQYARLLGGVARRVCGRRYQALVPDIEQEIRLALWKKLQAGNDIQHPASYLYKVALATSLAVIRRYRPEREQLEAEPVEPRQEDLSGLDRLLPAERAHLLEEVIGTLEPDAARALRGYLTGLSHEELAVLYGWSPSVARHLVYRSIERLRECVGGLRA